MSEIIELKQFDMANERVTLPQSLYIELAENYLMYVAEYHAEQPKAEDKDDHTLGWEETYANFKIKIKRDVLVAIDINWNDKREFWQVELEAIGYPNTIKFYFETESEAQIVHKKLDEYIFDKK